MELEEHKALYEDQINELKSRIIALELEAEQ